MTSFFQTSQASATRKTLSSIILITFIFSTLTTSQSYAGTTSANLPQLLSLTPAYTPLMVNGMTIHPENPFQFDFIVDTGASGLKGQALNDESLTMIKYFLASMTTPEKEMWVNLSPLEKDRIVPQGFGQTDMGRDLLAQDYMLKKLTASLMYPEGETGKKFWAQIYKEAQAKFGSASVPVNTFNKVWIMPGTASVYEHGNHVYVTSSRLKVMLESDYMAMKALTKQADKAGSTQQALMTKEIIRHVILPAIEKEVNEGKTFAQLRQMYTTMILASWYKTKLKNSILTQAYANKNKVAGIDIADKNAKDKIYKNYLETFKKGVYNYIKEEFDPITKTTVPRKYFSGGANVDLTQIGGVKIDAAMPAGIITKPNQLAISWDAATVADRASTVEVNPLDGLSFYGNHADRFVPGTSIPIPVFQGTEEEARNKLGGKGVSLSGMSSPELQAAYKVFVPNSGLPRTRKMILDTFDENDPLRAYYLGLLNNRAYLESLNLNVPPGFTSTTDETGKWKVLIDRGRDAVLKDREELKEFLKTEAGVDLDDSRDAINWDLLDGLTAEEARKIKIGKEIVEHTTGKKLGDTVNTPLLVAGRSGARISMPGMMDTVLNISVNEDSINAIALKGRAPGTVLSEEDLRGAWDTYRRWIEMFSRTVLDIHKNDQGTDAFNEILDGIRERRDHVVPVDFQEHDLTADTLEAALAKIREDGFVVGEGNDLTALNSLLHDEGVANELLARGKAKKLTIKANKLVHELNGKVPDAKEVRAILDANYPKNLPERNTQLTKADNEEAVAKYKEYLKGNNLVIPHNAFLGMLMVFVTVKRSTFGERARIYRELQKIEEATSYSAVNFVPMIFGNLNEKSGTLVAFSRDVSTGEATFKGAYLPNAQGEEVVAGTNDKEGDLQAMLRDENTREPALNLLVNMEFLEHWNGDAQDVEATYENNEQTGKTTLYMLQNRSAKRNARSAIRIANDMIEEQKIQQRQAKGSALTSREIAEIEYKALRTIDPDSMRDLLVGNFDKDSKQKAIEAGKLISEAGTKASSGAGIGRAVFDAKKAEELAKLGIPVILIRVETTTHDVGGMTKSKGILTLKGGYTSHAAVIARQFGIPAYVSLKNMRLEPGRAIFSVTRDGITEEVIVNEGDILGLDATNGQVFKLDTIDEIKIAESPIVLQMKKEKGVPLVQEMIRQNRILAARSAPELKAEFAARVIEYDEYVKKAEQAVVDNPVSDDDRRFYEQFDAIQQAGAHVRAEFKGLGIRGNAEAPLDVVNAVLFGAEGLGLVRTEHMFFEPKSRLLKVQRMFFSSVDKDGNITEESLAKVREALRGLLAYQESDFVQIFLALKGRPATIRYLDPPMHEFLPHDEEQLKILAVDIYGEGVTQEQMDEMRHILNLLREKNPMFGTRGVRLGVLIPDLNEIQTRAILNAQRTVRSLQDEHGVAYEANPELMLPLVGSVEEFLYVSQSILHVANEMGLIRKKDYYLGTMIEIVAGILNAAKLAKVADFFSFGTNDETQGVKALSRDDGNEFIAMIGRLRGTDSPFASLDPQVAEFTLRAVVDALHVDPNFKLGICGTQGTDPRSIENYLARWLTYVSGDAPSLTGANIAASRQAKVKKVTGEARVEPTIVAKSYVKIGFDPDQPIANQVAAAVAYLDDLKLAGNVTEQDVRTVLAHINLPKDAQAFQELEGIPEYQKLIGYVQQWGTRTAVRRDGRMAVQVTADDMTKVKVNGTDGVGYVDTDNIIKGDEKLRRSFLAYLLIRAAGKEDQLAIDGLYGAWGNALKQRLGKTGEQNKEVNLALPNQPLSSFFEFGSDEADDINLRAVASSLGIEYNEAVKLREKYHESNPVIGERGSRVISKDATSDLYSIFAVGSINAAHDAGYVHVKFILPFVESSLHVSEILEGKIADGEVVFPSLDAAIKDTVAHLNGPMQVGIGVSIDAPSATIIKKGAGDIAKIINGDMIVNVPELIEKTWSINRQDFFKKGAVGPKYVKDIWGQNIFDYVSEEVLRLVRETIQLAKASNPKGRVVVISSNPMDAELLKVVRFSGADAVVFQGQEMPMVHAGLLFAAIASARYAVGDKALISALKDPSADLGGISLDAGMLSMTIKRDGNGMPLPMNLQSNAIVHLNGLRPVIKSIETVNVPQLFGL